MFINIYKFFQYFFANFLSFISNQFYGSHTYGILIKNKKFQFLVDPIDMGLGLIMRRFGEYGVSELKQINNLINHKSDVLFIGSHIGALSIPTSFECKKIYMIEANPDTFEFLKLNCLINKVKNAEIYNFAASENDGKISFVKNTVNSAGSKRLPLIRKNMYFYDNPEIIEITSRKLDDIFQNNIFDLIFMDIEGSEYFALLGMQSILKKSKSLIIEFVPHHLKFVSNVTISDFINLIKPHYNFLTIPSLNTTVSKNEFKKVLIDMFDQDLSDDGIIFIK